MFYTASTMPITQSAKKALRQSAKRQKQNTQRKETYKKAVKSLRKLVVGKKGADAATAIPMTFKALDKAAKSNVITKNKASRLKSRIAHAIAKSTKASS